jgi:hypothetical protein
MRFDVESICRINPSCGIDGSHEGRLRVPIGERDARRSAILVKCRVENNSMNWVFVFDSMAQFLQDDGCDACRVKVSLSAFACETSVQVRFEDEEIGVGVGIPSPRAYPDPRLSKT